VSHGRRGVGLLMLVLAPAAAHAGGAADKPRLVDLAARRERNEVTLSFRLERALTRDARERIGSGLPVVQRHQVELVRPRAVPLWPAHDLARMLIETSAVYDSLTRRYELTRTIRVGRRKKELETVADDRLSVESIAEVERWLSVFEGLPPLEVAESEVDARLKLRVESTLDRHYAFYLFPARLTVSDELKLEP